MGIKRWSYWTSILRNTTGSPHISVLRRQLPLQLIYWRTRCVHRISRHKADTTQLLYDAFGCLGPCQSAAPPFPSKELHTLHSEQQQRIPFPSHLLAYNLNKGTVISFTPHFFLLIRDRMVLRSSRPFIYHSSDKFSYRVCNRCFLFSPRYSSILKKTHCFSNTLAVFSKYCFKIMTHLYHYPASPPAVSFTEQISLLLVVSMLSKGRTKLGNLRNVHRLK